MDWTNYVSQEDMRYIDSNHGTERFRQIVHNVWWAAAMAMIKKRLPEEYHLNFDMSMRGLSKPGQPLHGIKEHIGDGISDKLAELDNRYGAPAQMGIAWVNAKSIELTQHIESFFNPQRTR